MVPALASNVAEATTIRSVVKYELQMATIRSWTMGISPEAAMVAAEAEILEFDLIEYDGSAFSALSGGLMAGTSGSATVGGNVTAVTAKGIKLVNVRKLAAGSTTQTTTYVLNKCYLQNGWTVAFKSDNDSDPVAVYSFTVTAEQYATAGTIYTKTVA